MNRRILVGIPVLVAGMSLGIALSAQSKPKVEVYKDPTCGCCGKWVEHLRAAGFDTTVNESANVQQIKTTRHVPPQARSCHTALVAGYVIEGHVPAQDIQRLLKQRPAGVLGLAVAGMPGGSPGMEVAGGRAQP